MNKRVALILTVSLAWHGSAHAHSDTSGFAADHHHHEETGPAAVEPRQQRFPATVRFDPQLIENVVLKVNARVAGLENIFVGRKVSEGETLAEFESAELETLQRTYLGIFRNIQRIAQISLTSEEKLIEGRMNLEWRGLSEDGVQLIEDLRKPLTSVPIESPVDGYIFDIRVVDGQIVNAGAASGLFSTAGTTVFRVASSASIIVEAEIPAEQSREMQPGSPATLWVTNGGGREPLRAMVDQVSGIVNPANQRRLVRLTPIPGPGIALLRDGARLQVSIGGQS